MSIPKKLADILPPELQEGIAEKLEDHLDQPLVIHTCREVTGTHGKYMRLVVSTPGNPDQFYLATGASQPMEILQYLKDQRQFPVEATFTRVGRAIIVK